MLRAMLSLLIILILGASLVSSRAIASVQQPFTVDVIRKTRKENPRLEKRKQGTAPANSHPGYRWTAPMSIGSPLQNFDIEIDTGSGDFWLLGPSASGQPNPAPMYVPDASRSWRNGTTGVPTWHATYSGGGRASGYIGHDDVTIGTLKIINAMIEVSSESTWAASGLMGLAPTFADPKKCNMRGRLNLYYAESITDHIDEPPPFITSLMQNLDDQVFTVHLLKDGTGTYGFGAIGHAGDITYVPIDNSQAAWNIANIKFSIDGTPTSASAGTSCVADTGGRHMTLDPAIVKAYYDQIPGSIDTSSAKDGSSWTIPCHITHPDLGFHFDKVIGTVNNPVVVAGKYMIGGNTVNADMTVGACDGALRASSTGQSCGGPFFEANYVVFDYGRMALGYASHA